MDDIHLNSPCVSAIFETFDDGYLYARCDARFARVGRALPDMLLRSGLYLLKTNATQTVRSSAGYVMMTMVFPSLCRLPVPADEAAPV